MYLANKFLSLLSLLHNCPACVDFAKIYLFIYLKTMALKLVKYEQNTDIKNTFFLPSCL